MACDLSKLPCLGDSDSPTGFQKDQSLRPLLAFLHFHVTLLLKSFEIFLVPIIRNIIPDFALPYLGSFPSGCITARPSWTYLELLSLTTPCQSPYPSMWVSGWQYCSAWSKTPGCEVASWTNYSAPEALIFSCGTWGHKYLLIGIAVKIRETMFAKHRYVGRTPQL